jgi:hypothetical protein
MFNPKIILASQAEFLKFKNAKRKLFSCNANIYFNQNLTNLNMYIDDFLKYVVSVRLRWAHLAQASINFIKIRRTLTMYHVKVRFG